MRLQTSLVHSASVTAANFHDCRDCRDCRAMPNMWHSEDTQFHGDSACRDKAQRLKAIAPKAKDFAHKRAYWSVPLTETGKAANQRKSTVRSKVEHPFLTLNRC